MADAKQQVGKLSDGRLKDTLNALNLDAGKDHDALEGNIAGRHPRLAYHGGHGHRRRAFLVRRAAAFRQPARGGPQAGAGRGRRQAGRPPG
jgi:hypothetical protein